MRFGQINFAQGFNNPAAIAIDGKLMADFLFRNQWAGIEGAPITGGFNAQYEINNGMAVGLTASYDRIGSSETGSAALQYAYRIHFDGNRSFIMGLGLGVDNTVNFLANTKLTDPNDPVFEYSYGRSFLNGSFGLYFNTPRFYAGASIPRLFQNDPYGKDRGFQPPRWHYYLNTGFYIDGGDNYVFNPHIQVKLATNAPIQGDLILRNTFYNRFSFVVGYRSENALIAGFDIRFSGYARLGYSFNYNLGRLSSVKGASNEVYLGLAFPYHDDRADFGQSRYYNKKGRNQYDFRRGSKRKHFRRGRPYGNRNKYR
jgi:type IX secretion system PorP/SprF family membrane protein